MSGGFWPGGGTWWGGPPHSPALAGWRSCLVGRAPPFRGGTLEKILPGVEKCVAPGGIVLCESETGLVLPAEVGSLTLKKQYKYGKVLLWKYTKPMAAEEETGGVEE